jgi:hypothetical protein
MVVQADIINTVGMVSARLARMSECNFEVRYTSNRVADNRHIRLRTCSLFVVLLLAIRVLCL